MLDDGLMSMRWEVRIDAGGGYHVWLLESDLRLR
jgi:hypothetical protein